MVIIRRELHHWYKEFINESMELEDQVHLAIELIERTYTEEKLAGTLFLQEILLPAGAIHSLDHLERFALLFDTKKIYDWNVCDRFCVKVLGPLIQREGPPWAEGISQWRTATNLWRARASLVAFVRVTDEPSYYPEMEHACRILIRRPERFAKIGVGWILREISVHNKSFVRNVIEANLPFFSPESLKNATKYLDSETRQYFKQLFTKKT